VWMINQVTTKMGVIDLQRTNLHGPAQNALPVRRPKNKKK
jgi:hypothetical protein